VKLTEKEREEERPPKGVGHGELKSGMVEAMATVPNSVNVPLPQLDRLNERVDKVEEATTERWVHEFGQRHGSGDACAWRSLRRWSGSVLCLGESEKGEEVN
jgi:hypothetical protein